MIKSNSKKSWKSPLLTPLEGIVGIILIVLIVVLVYSNHSTSNTICVGGYLHSNFVRNIHQILDENGKGIKCKSEDNYVE